MDREILRQIREIKDSMATMQDSITLLQADMNRRFGSLQHSTCERLDALQTPVKRHIEMFDNQIGPFIHRVAGFAETIDERFNTVNRELWPRFNGIDKSIDGLNQSTKQQSQSMTRLLQEINRHSTDQVRIDDQQFRNFHHEIANLVNETSDTVSSRFEAATSKLEERMDKTSDALSSRFETATSKLEECMDKTSDTLNGRFDTTTRRLEEHMDKNSDTLNGRFETATKSLEDSVRAVEEKSANLETCFRTARLATLDESVQSLQIGMQRLKIEMQAG